MSAKFTIKDGQSGSKHGPELEACVKNTENHEHSLCTNISGVSKGVRFPVTTGVASLQVGGSDVRFSQDGDGVTFNMAVDGDPTPIDFEIHAHPDYDTIITEIIFQALSGQIKMTKFLDKNSALTNGVQVSYKADDNSSSYLPIKTTSDFEVFSSIAGFNVTVESGGDVVKATRDIDPAFVLRQQNTFGTSVGDDDYVRVTIQDDIDTVGELYAYIRGYYTAPGEI